MASEFDFNDNYDIEKLTEKVNPELIKNLAPENPAFYKDNSEENKEKKDFLPVEFPFNDMLPEDMLSEEEKKKREKTIKSFTEEPVVNIFPEQNNLVNKPTQTEFPNYAPEQKEYSNEMAIPYDTPSYNSNSYLALVLSPNLRELELMIRGLEYVKKVNPVTRKEEYILRKIQNHPLNEYGINQIITQLKIYTSPEIKLGRKTTKDYYSSVRHVCHTITRLVYKNLKAFGMDTQEKQRNAKGFCDAIIETIDASFSRSVGGRENDLSRASEIRLEGSLDGYSDPSKLFSKGDKDRLKN